MIDVSISTAESGAKKVRLGKQGENGVRKIIFDLQSMVNRYGDGLATLVFQRNGDTAPYVVTATREENSLVWIVSSTDTAKAGPGRAEIRWFVDGALAKTVIFATETIASIVEDTEMPDVMQTWYDQMVDYVDAQPQIVIGEVQRMIDGKADAAAVDNVYAKKTDIPTKLSKLTNDAGFISEIPEEYVTDTELEDVRTSLSAMIGSPLVAASAAEMTDTDRVYVYTGAETGYENGDWYYYDSGIGQWRSGGVYNSTAVTTDKTLSVENSAADAKATGDAIDSLNEDITNSLDSVDTEIGEIKENFDLINDGKNTAHLSWEHGTISQTDGTNVDPATTTRARNIGYLSTNCVLKVNHSNVAWGTYLFYYNKYKRFQMRTEQIQSAEITPNRNYPFFRIGILRRLSTTGDVDLEKATNDFTIVDTLEFVRTTDEKIDKLQNDYESLYIGELENKHLKANGNVDDEYSNYRLSSKNIVALPKGSARKLKVQISPDYLASLRTGKSSTNLNNSQYWFCNGDTITIPDGDNYYALSFCVNDGVGYASYLTTEITPSDVSKMHANLLFVSHNENDDAEAEKVFNASRLLFNSTSPNSIDNMPVIGHTSDCHGDYARVKNFLDFCDKIKVDVAAITGDIVSYNPNQGITWFKELIANARSLSAICVGNHDAFDNTLDDTGVYDIIFSGIESKIGNTTGKTWYYTDITAKSLRIISVNLYQYGGTTRNYTHFTNEQIEWLCQTLLSTPSGYGVIMLYHSPQINVDMAVDPNYNKFFQATRKYSNIYSAVNGSPINDIIDAFIQKTTISKSYTQTGTPSSITVSADFSALNTGVEFIAHLTGHFHQDSVCYVPSTAEKQLMLNVVCTNALYGGSAYPYLCDVSDLPRSKEDITQNSFNLYVIDRTNGLVKITRIGSNTTYDMKKRDYMEIPYK